MARLKMVSGLSRKSTVADLELGQVFEYQGDAYLCVKIPVDVGVDMISALNLTTFTVVPINKGTAIFRLEAELQIK